MDVVDFFLQPGREIERAWAMADMTPTQGRYLSYIHAYTEGFGLPPAESEIASALGVSPPSVNQMMKTLEKKGLIRRQPGVPRSIEVLVSPRALPKWQGKRITRTVREWTIAGPARRPIRQENSDEATVYCFRITLRDTEPAIWRRVETKDVSLLRLHLLIQTAMGWTNSHLHQFEIAGSRFTDPRLLMDDPDAIDYSRLRVSDLVASYGSKLRMLYEYDFGDGWQHDVVLEKVTSAEPKTRYPRCSDGGRACPPEDVGGVHGFADFLEAISNPNHEEHQDYLEWNGPFDPARFHAQQASRRMRKGLPTW